MDSSTVTLLLRERIIALRQKHKSYREIAGALGISKGTVSYWLAANTESQAIKKILTEKQRIWSRKHMTKIAKAASKRWELWRAEARKEAEQQFPFLLKNPLFVAGVTMYWGEGDSKMKNPLRLSNTDPRMIHLYVKFLREILGVPNQKIRVALILYPDLHDVDCKRFWSRVTGLAYKNFIKTQYIRGYHPTKRLQYGVCVVIVSSRQLKEKFGVWIDLLSRQATMRQSA